MAFSLSQLRSSETNNVKYLEVEAYGDTVKIGSLSSADMLEWIEANRDEQKKKRAGLRLLAKSVVDGDTNTRIPSEELEAAIAEFAQKNAEDNGKVLEQVLLLNGFTKEQEKTEDAKKS